MPIISANALIGAGLFLGGIFGGIIGATKLPMFRNNRGSTPPVSVSKKTGGNLHISEEALGKITGLETKMDEDFLTKDKHADLCQIANLEIKDFIKEKIEASTEQILTAIKTNGGG